MSGSKCNLAEFRTSSLDAFTLLEKIGRDAAGAVQPLSPNSPAPVVTETHALLLNEAQVAQHLPEEFPTQVSNTIFEGMRQQANKLK